MRKLFAILCVGLMACAGWAEPRHVAINIPMGAATASTQTLANVRGYLDTVYVTVSDGASTGTVSLATVPLDSNMSAITAVSRAVTNEATFRPSVDRTTTAGADLTNDPPGLFPLAGDSLRLIVSSSPTGVTWRASVYLADR
jgi:hypothetical protein